MNGTPELLVAVASGKLDGTIMGETEAYSGCLSNPDLTIVYFDEGKGFDVALSDCSAGIAVRKADTELLDQINAVVATLDREKEDFDENINKQHHPEVYRRGLRPIASDEKTENG